MCMKQQVGIEIDSKLKNIVKTDKQSLKIEILYVIEMIYLVVIKSLN